MQRLCEGGAAGVGQDPERLVCACSDFHCNKWVLFGAGLNDGVTFGAGGASDL